MTLQILCIAAFYLLVFAVGVYASRKASDKTSQGLLLANRNMPLWIGVMTMTATWVGGGYINGTAEAVYDPNVGLVWAQAPWCYALSMALGGLFFATRMRRLRFTTLLDPLEIRYGKRVAACLFLAAFIGDLFWSAAILVALGSTFGTVLGLDISSSILISAMVAIGYTVVGGLWSVAYTDVIQLVFLLLGLCVAIPFATSSVGGLDEALSTYVQKMPSFPEGSAIWRWGDMALLLIFGGIPWQVYFQRVLSARSERTAVGLSLLASFGCLLMAVPAVILGAIGTIVDWQPMGVDPESSPAMVLPYVLRYLTPPLVATIGLGAIAAAVMSSVDSSILSASSMFAWNVYRPILRPDASDLELRRVVRVAIVLTGTFAAGLALTTQSVYALWYLSADLVYVILFPQLVMALFSQVANRWGASAGAIVGLTLRLGGGEPLFGIPAFIPYPLTSETGCDFPFRTVSMLGGLATIWIVSLATQRRCPPESLRSNEGDLAKPRIQSSV